jgi:hypothetical protein
MTPPAFVKGEEPNAPAKKRRTISDSIFCAPAQLPEKAAMIKKLKKNGICLPMVSLRGA